MGKSILQSWVTDLGLRHQGVLLASVRGCDTSQRESPDKFIVRIYRSVILESFCGDPRKAQSFITYATPDDIRRAFVPLIKSHDHLPHHYLMHLIHAAEIIGYCHPNPEIASPWRSFYSRMCGKLHMTPETETEMNIRLTQEESAFFAHQ